MDSGELPSMQQVEHAVASQLQARFMEEMMQLAVRKCFKQCVTSPSTKLSEREKTCLENCVDRLVDGMNTVSSTMASK